VVAVAIIGVLRIALTGHTQPATHRAPSHGDAPPQARAAPAPTYTMVVHTSPLRRIGSGLALLVLVTFVGAVVAGAIGTMLVLVSLALRQASN